MAQGAGQAIAENSSGLTRTTIQLRIDENRCGFASEISIDGNRMDIARHLFRLPTSAKLAESGKRPRNIPLSLPYGFFNSARQLGSTARTFGRSRVSDWPKCLFPVCHYPSDQQNP
jgi:hypothetical protein